MFSGFLFHLRACGLKVSLTEWLALVDALARGHARCNLDVFYHVARALLVKKESHFDLYDQAFAAYFRGVEMTFDIDEEDLRNRIKNKMIRPTTIPQSMEELIFEQAIAKEALRLAFIQHKSFATVLKALVSGQHILVTLDFQHDLVFHRRQTLKQLFTIVVKRKHGRR